MRAHRIARVAVHLGACLSLCAVVHAGVVQIVGKPGLGTFSDIQAAVDVASDGDVLVVAKGTYSGFTLDGKALWVLAFPPNAPQSTVNGTVTIRNLPVGSTVVIAGLSMKGAFSSYTFNPGLKLDDCAGSIMVRQCIIKGGSFNNTSSTKPPAPSGARIASCQRVFLVGCAITGGDGVLGYDDPGQAGGIGLESVNSAVALYETALRGGKGGDEGYPSGGKGGTGCRVNGWGIFLSGSPITGGKGGDGSSIFCGLKGDGGDALVITTAQALILDSPLTGGAPATYGCPPGSPGQQLIATGANVVNLPGQVKRLVAPWLAGDASALTLSVHAQPGDAFHFLFARGPNFMPQVSVNGVWAVPPPVGASAPLLGIVPALGTLQVLVQLRNLGGSPVATRFFGQGLCEDSAGSQWLTTPLYLAVLDRGGLPDCNGNGQLDLIDILEGFSLDLNNNLNPDECPGG